MKTLSRRTPLAAKVDDSKLLELTAEWWSIENAANECREPPLTDDERTELLDGHDPIVPVIISTPAHTMQGLVAKIRIYCEYYSVAGMESEYWSTDQVLASAMQDAERLASEGGAS